MNDNEILDDEEINNGKKSRLNYRKYLTIYLLLILSVSWLLVKSRFGFNSSFNNLIIATISYVLIPFLFSLIVKLLQVAYNTTFNRRNKSDHPFWFELVEFTFYSWCFFIFLTFIAGRFL